MSRAMAIFSTDLLDGKVALITGGGSGINYGIARALFDHGASVSLVSRTQEKLDRAAAELDDSGERARGFAADVRDEESLQAAIDQTVQAFGGLDILVNGAAGNFIAPASQLSPNGFKAVMDIDARGTFNASRLCFEALAGADDGAVIINISAAQAWIPTPLQVHAGAAKAAVQKMTQDLALEWGAAGIRVVGISPGPIEDTEGMKRLATPELRDKLLRQMPASRFGTAGEIGLAAVFLCSEAARFITGTTLVVDGGQSLVGAGAFLDMLG